MLMAVDNGFQAVLWPPTEILAQQHFETLSEYTKEMNLEIGILTGSSTNRKKERFYTRN